MNYKKILKNQKKRIKIIRMLDFIPDKTMLKIQYKIKTGHKLNLDNPKRYSEKIQWYKLNFHNCVMAQCSDKYDVRNFVIKRGLENILNEVYGIYNHPDEIDFDKLPDAFVLKDTLGGGGNSVILVENKKSIDKEFTYSKMLEWVNEPINRKHPGREWVYEGRKHRIIIEKILIPEGSMDLPDYKIFCFNGVPFCIYMMQNYTKNHSLGELSFFDCDFNMLPVKRLDFKSISQQPPKPKNFDKMITYAKILSEGFPHVRVDFYNIDGEIFFGEMTFFNASGYIKFDPDKFDYILGERFELP